jgi:hypothetical protein
MSDAKRTFEEQEEFIQYGRVLSLQEREELKKYKRTLRPNERKLVAAREEALKYGALLRTDNGKLLLQALVDLYYDADLIGRDSREDAINLGKREVVRFLLDLQARKE